MSKVNVVYRQRNNNSYGVFMDGEFFGTAAAGRGEWKWTPAILAQPILAMTADELRSRIEEALAGLGYCQTRSMSATAYICSSCGTWYNHGQERRGMFCSHWDCGDDAGMLIPANSEEAKVRIKQIREAHKIDRLVSFSGVRYW